MALASLVILGVLLVVSVSFLVIPPKRLRKIYPGWIWLESRMWGNRICNWLLMRLVGEGSSGTG